MGTAGPWAVPCYGLRFQILGETFRACSATLLSHGPTIATPPGGCHGKYTTVARTTAAGHDHARQEYAASLCDFHFDRRVAETLERLLDECQRERMPRPWC